jgi:hypothetical protein
MGQGQHARTNLSSEKVEGYEKPKFAKDWTEVDCNNTAFKPDNNMIKTLRCQSLKPRNIEPKELHVYLPRGKQPGELDAMSARRISFG